jgi:hypothetical protein
MGTGPVEAGQKNLGKNGKNTIGYKDYSICKVLKYRLIGL